MTTITPCAEIGYVRIPSHLFHRLQAKAEMFDYLSENCTYLEDGPSRTAYWANDDDRRPAIELADYCSVRMTGEELPALPPEDPTDVKTEEWLPEPELYRNCRAEVCEL